eukprot:6546362-Prymnesium_polylepis.2
MSAPLYAGVRWVSEETWLWTGKGIAKGCVALRSPDVDWERSWRCTETEKRLALRWWTQCAAVSTMAGAMSEPPQICGR